MPCHFVKLPSLKTWRRGAQTQHTWKSLWALRERHARLQPLRSSCRVGPGVSIFQSAQMTGVGGPQNMLYCIKMAAYKSGVEDAKGLSVWWRAEGSSQRLGAQCSVPGGSVSGGQRVCHRKLKGWRWRLKSLCWKPEDDVQGESQDWHFLLRFSFMPFWQQSSLGGSSIPRTTLSQYGRVFLAQVDAIN